METEKINNLFFLDVHRASPVPTFPANKQFDFSECCEKQQPENNPQDFVSPKPKLR